VVQKAAQGKHWENGMDEAAAWGSVQPPKAAPVNPIPKVKKDMGFDPSYHSYVFFPSPTSSLKWANGPERIRGLSFSFNAFGGFLFLV